MSMQETNGMEKIGIEAKEFNKINELKSKLETKDTTDKEKDMERVADDLLEKRISESGTEENRLNKGGEVSFGTSGCAAFCRKVHDGTSVHGTY